MEKGESESSTEPFATRAGSSFFSTMSVMAADLMGMRGKRRVAVA